MSEQLLKFAYIFYCLKVNTFLKYLLISGAILIIDFDNFFVKYKNYEIYQKKIDLTYQTGEFYCRFLHTKNTQEGRAYNLRISALAAKKRSNQKRVKIKSSNYWYKVPLCF